MSQRKRKKKYVTVTNGVSFSSGRLLTFTKGYILFFFLNKGDHFEKLEQHRVRCMI